MNKKNLPQPSKEPDKLANYRTVKNRKPKRGGLGCSLAVLVLLLGLTAGIVLGGPRLLAFVDQTGAMPQVVTDNTSPAALAARHNQELAQLNGYGWVDKGTGIARIPIARAIALVAQSNLPVGAVAPEKGTATAESTAGDAPPAESTVDLTNVSFQKDVLPIFTDRCAECHGTDEPEEGLVLTSYKDVMVGSIYGSVVKPGDPDNSYLVEMVSTGQMPKKGADLTPTQIDTIVAWIKAGALDN